MARPLVPIRAGATERVRRLSVDAVPPLFAAANLPLGSP